MSSSSMNFSDRLQEDIVKIIVIGDAKVGKTSFIQRYVNNCYIKDYKCTIGVDFETKVLNEHGGKPVKLKLQFWDIAGQDRYTLLTRAYFRYARGCIIMFDLNKSESFENVKKWKKSVESNISDDGSSQIPCLLVANKLDLLPKMVTYTEIEELCKDFAFIQWTETSVKDGINVNEAVTYLLDVILDRSPNTYIPSDYEIVDPIHLADYKETPKRKSCKICQ